MDHGDFVWLCLAEDSSTPTDSEDSSTPTDSEDSSTPTDSEDSSTPTDSEDSSTPTDSEDSSTPTDSEDSSTPTDSDDSSTPTDSEDSLTPTDSEDSSTPTDSDDSSTPTDSEDSSTPTDSEDSSTPTDSEDRSTHTESEDSSTPTDSEHCTNNTHEIVDNTTPTDTENNTAPTDSECVLNRLARMSCTQLILELSTRKHAGNMSTETSRITEFYTAVRTIYILGIVFNGVASQLSSSPVVVRESQTASFRWQVPAVTGSSALTSLWIISPSGSAVLLSSSNNNNHQIAPDYTARVTYTGNIAANPRIMAFDLRSVVRSDAGDYLCGRNGVFGIIPQCGQKLVVLGQPTKPTLNGPSSPVFGRQFTLTCSSTSTTVPADHGQTLTYTWQRNNTNITVTSPGSLYTFTVSSRDSHYRCKATEGQGPESEWSQLYNMEPLYGPYAVNLQPSALSYTRREGQESVPSILCSATCRPACTSYKWFKDGTVHSDGATLTLPVADRSQTGSYKCQASNTHGTDNSSSVSVDVTHHASISMLTANSRNGSVTVNESDVVILRCQLNNAGKPRSVIRLLNGTEGLTRADNSLTAEYRLESADCRQRGNYYCTANNNIGAPVSQTVELRVKCSPRLAATVPTQLKYAARLGGNVNVSVIVLAYPLPTFTWSRTNCTSQDLTGSSSHVSDISVTARLHLTDLQQQDVGDYRLTVDNGVGSSVTYTLTIESADPPDQQKLETPCSCTGVIVGSTVGGILLTLLVGGSVHMVLYRKGYKFGHIPEEPASRKRTRNPETVEMDNRGYSSLDQINGPAQYSNLEEPEKQQYSQLKIYENTKGDAAADTSTYEGMGATPPVTYESVRVSPYQNTGAHSQADAEKQTSTYEGMTVGPQVSHEAISASPYQNSSAQYRGDD
ncbi:cell adhesion molecule CEACAM5-like [Haliotis cracherodii]|uniref:cell adhesion molecule CEACAM5-like n=1 Tax=Haliotis cracherodii TaxID=6455 RepID=UPI0039EBDBBE